MVYHNDGRKAVRSAAKPGKGEYLNAYLSRGKATGNPIFRSVVGMHGEGTKLRCTYGCVGGRGLRVAEDVKKNVVIAKGYGKLVDIEEAKHQTGFKVFDSKNRVLLLDVPTKEFPANLANTSDGIISNNCAILHKAGTNYFSVKTVKALKAGDEVVCPYGAKYTRELRVISRNEEVVRQQLAQFSLGAVFECGVCKQMVKKYKMIYDAVSGKFRHKMPLLCLNVARRMNAGKL
jgi:hypothetical protein